MFGGKKRLGGGTVLLHVGGLGWGVGLLQDDKGNEFGPRPSLSLGPRPEFARRYPPQGKPAKESGLTGMMVFKSLDKS